MLLPGIGLNAGGSSRWVGVGQLRLQPSELMKLAICVFGADLLARAFRAAGQAVGRSPASQLARRVGLLVLTQPDMGTAIVVTCITFSLLFAAGVPLRPDHEDSRSVAVIGVVGLAEPYRRDRLLSFLNPFAHSSGTGYQVVQSLVGIGSGRLFGLGLGAGREKWGLLPNPHTDFIFSVIGEETGLIGTLLVLGLFLCLGWLGLRAADRAPDRFATLLAVGITFWIVSQAVINIGAVIDVLPVTGIPLPFVSFGGSSLVITLAAAGILVNIASQRAQRSAGAVGRGMARSRGVPSVVDSLRRRDPGERPSLRARHRRRDCRPYRSRAGGRPGSGRRPGPGSVELVGSRRGLDAKLLSGVGLPVTLLGGRGSPDARARRAGRPTLGAVWALAAAFVASLVLVARRRPSVVVAVGGYASVAPTVAAAVFRRPASCRERRRGPGGGEPDAREDRPRPPPSHIRGPPCRGRWSPVPLYVPRSCPSPQRDRDPSGHGARKATTRPSRGRWW